MPRGVAPGRAEAGAVRTLLIAFAVTCAALAGRPAVGEVQEGSWPSALEERVAAAEAELHGAASVYVRDLQTGEELRYQAEVPMYLASAVKVSVMVEVLRQVDAGELRLDELVTFGPEDLRDGMNPMAQVAPGTQLSVATLLEYMMVYSDNAAADLLIARVGVENLNRGLAQRGIAFGPIRRLIDVRRRAYAKLDPRALSLTPAQIHELGRQRSVEARARRLSELMGRQQPWTGRDLDAAFQAFYADRFNSAPMEQMGQLLAQLGRCVGLSEGSCSLARSLMERCHTGRARIAAGLDGRAQWAHKTGTQYRRACDVGLLAVGQRQFAVAACTRDFARVADAERFLARLGEALVETLAGPEVLGAAPPVH